MLFPAGKYQLWRAYGLKEGLYVRIAKDHVEVVLV